MTWLIVCDWHDCGTTTRTDTWATTTLANGKDMHWCPKHTRRPITADDIRKLGTAIFTAGTK